jgi:flavorubredoxin
MNVAVRYYSQSGRTEKIAQAIARGAGVQAVSITQEPALLEQTDLLFLGGAPYANIMAPQLKTYAENLSAAKVKKVVLFTTSNWSRRTVLALKKQLKSQGIRVPDESFYAQAAKVDGKINDAEKFGKEMSVEK